MYYPPWRLTIAAIVVLLVGGSGGRTADDPAVGLSEAEQAFVKMLSGRNMIGAFTVEGRDDRTPKEERYEIGKVTKVEGDLWTIEARIKYGKVDATVPVPVHVLWAGDTPMISVTNLTIPLVGSEFSARVLFYDNLYAGTWKHGSVGGHMWGRIEDRPAAGAPAAP
jgi:hypothetical protein